MATHGVGSSCVFQFHLTMLCCYYLVQNFQVDVLGIDLSTNMIGIAKERAVEFEDNKVLRRGDTQRNYVRGGSARTFNPLPFNIPLWGQNRDPFIYLQ